MKHIPEPIAIVSIGGVFPGCRSLQDYWRIIEQGIDTSRRAPPNRWILDPAKIINQQTGATDCVYTDRACFIENFELDRSGLNLPAGLLEELDPVYHLLLEAGRNAFCGARMESVDRSRVGVIVGNIALPTDASSTLCERVLGAVFDWNATENDAPGGEPIFPNSFRALNRYVSGLPAGILASALGLGAGSYTLDAACASSLYALKLACDELQAGRADAMLAGGLSRPDSLYTQMGFSQLRALATSGRCSPFDVAGSGLIVGEGSGVVVLKRLSDALAAGDDIHAVIKGIGLSNDLDGNLLSPSSEGQLRALNLAYQAADWTPDMVDMIECHATGTPVGDAVEFESLSRLWKDRRRNAGPCVLGAVKSNIGHLLTGAGSAGLIKILLALKHNTLPATANFNRPSEKIPLDGSPFQILKKSQPWARRNPETPRRAAINGFGFGGINAHVLIEEWMGKADLASPKGANLSPPADPIAIVGMATMVGKWTTLQAFQRRVLGGDDETVPAERESWRGISSSELHGQFGANAGSFPGYYLDDLAIPVNRYRIPPKELGELLPQQALMLEAARAALTDAQVTATEASRTGVFIGLGLDLRTTDFHFRWAMRELAERWGAESASGTTDEANAEWVRQMEEGAGPALTADRTMGALAGINASRIAKEFHFGGATHTVCGEDCSGIRALEIGVRALQKGELDVVLTGAVDLTGDLRALLATDQLRPYSRGTARPFDEAADGTVPGEGAVALVLKRLDDALRDGDRIYSVIRGIGSASGGGIGQSDENSDGWSLALKRAYVEAGVAPETVEYVEANAGGCPEEDRREARALAVFFDMPGRTRICRVGSAKAEVGHAGAASGLVSVAKASLAIYREIIPPLRGLRKPLPELGGTGSLSAPRAPQQWVRNRNSGPRKAGVSCASVDGNWMHVVLEGNETQKSERVAIERSYSPAVRSEALFVFAAANVDGLMGELTTLRELAGKSKNRATDSLAREWWQSRKATRANEVSLALVAQDGAQLERLLAAAMEGVRRGELPKIAGEGAERNQDRDRLFYSAPGKRIRGGIAFVFPGAGNSFADMGRELALLWPGVLRQQDAENLSLASQMFADRFWNGALDGGPGNDHRAVICGQVAFGTFASDLAAQFGVKPEVAIGYSLGESTGLFALRAWTSRDEMLRRVSESTLFSRDLTGTPEMLRSVWKIPAGQSVEWKAGLVDRAADVVRAAAMKRERVYVLIVNTPGECVIGGDAAQVRSLVAELGCHWFPLEGVSTVHCELLRPFEKAYRDLHLFETTAPPGVRFYSGGWGRDYIPDRETTADAIVAQASGCIDFPKVVRAAYDSGVRFFVEMGPGNSCSRMIGQILAGQPHVARSLCATANETLLGVLRVLGHLASEGVPVNLESLYAGASGLESPLESAQEREVKRVRISITGATLNPPSWPESDHETAPGESEEFVSEGEVMDPFEAELLEAIAGAQTATLSAHQTYLEFSKSVFESISQNVESQFDLIGAGGGRRGDLKEASARLTAAVVARAKGEDIRAREDTEIGTTRELGRTATCPTIDNRESGAKQVRDVALEREACLEFGRGLVGKVLGEAFAKADSFPTRVRLPDEPLMLVDRIIEIDAVALSMTHGRVVTEHDIHPDAWYLDGGRIPTCIAVEAGQADLFLSGYLGIDFQTEGRAVYRLLDARVCFHESLPGPGSVIHYDIRIERFFRQGTTWLFRFNFEATVAGRPFLTMSDGCAGFFSAEELANGRGVIKTALELRPMPGKRPADWQDLVTMGIESYTEAQLDALRAGNLAACFGPQFANLSLRHPMTLPDGRMRLVHRIPQLDPAGGRFGMGLIRGEADIHPDDWFLTCHFVDDRVMPGTLMFECCLHTLRVFLLRMGWVVEAEGAALEPVPGVLSQLKCRGQVLETTSVVTYEVTIKELGFGPEPFVIADALMYADGKPIVDIANMSLRYSGVTREMIQQTWSAVPVKSGRKAVYGPDKIRAFAIGKPSEAFGRPYEVFDERRRIARLPGPPYQFLDRITEVQGEAFKMVPGGMAEAEYDIPVNEWYFAENRQGDMAFAVLLEIALQPCGWLAAYVGSALTSETDLSFRNLGGTGTQFVPVLPNTGTLTIRVKMTRASSSAGMIIQWFDFEVRAAGSGIYKGDTYFGFFPKAALMKQEGLQGAKLYQPSAAERERAKSFAYPEALPYPGSQLRMIDQVELFIPDGGPNKLGFIRGTKRVNADEWFFKAHFFQDPVVPGSLGLESFIQLLKLAAIERWGHKPGSRWESVVMNEAHEWSYRGQVIPTNGAVTVEAVVTAIDEDRRMLKADGYLSVDGRVIYGMKNFTVRRVDSQ